MKPIGVERMAFRAPRRRGITKNCINHKKNSLVGAGVGVVMGGGRVMCSVKK